MFKILHIKSNILDIKLEEEGGGHRMDVAIAVTARATMALTSGDDGGGRGDGGCSNSGNGDSFDVVSGIDDKLMVAATMTATAVVTVATTTTTVVAAATEKVVGTDNNQLKAAAEEMVAMAMVTATVTAITSKRQC